MVLFLAWLLTFQVTHDVQPLRNWTLWETKRINFLCSEWRKLSQIMIIDYFAEIFAELSILQVVAAPDAAV